MGGQGYKDCIQDVSNHVREHNLAATSMSNARKAAGIPQETHLNRTQFKTFETF